MSARTSDALLADPAPKVSTMKQIAVRLNEEVI